MRKFFTSSQHVNNSYESLPLLRVNVFKVKSDPQLLGADFIAPPQDNLSTAARRVLKLKLSHK